MMTSNPRGAEMVGLSSKQGTKAFSLLAVLFVLVFLLSTGARVARAQCTAVAGSNVINWTDTSGNWSTATNWDLNCAPNNGGGIFYNAVINGTGADTITVDASGTTINSLTVGTGETLQDNGAAPTLTIGDPSFPAAGSLSNWGTINWGAGAKLTLDITSGNGTIQNNGNINLTASTLALNDSGNFNTATLSGSGTITMSGATITGQNGTETLVNASNTIQGFGTISNLTLVNNGTINANAANPLTITPNSGGFINNGYVHVTGAGGMAVNGQMTNTNGSFGGLSVYNSTLTAGDFTNNGFVTVYGWLGSTTGSLIVGGAFHNVDTSGNLAGSWELGGGAVYYDGSGGVNGSQDITTIASGAALWLNGSSSGGFFGKTDPSYNHLALATNNGGFYIGNGANFTTPGDFTNNGYVELFTYLSGSPPVSGPASNLTVGGVFHNVDNSGNLTGSWYLQGGSVYYDGSGGVNGSQDITTITSGASLTLDGFSGSTVGFFGKTNPSYNHLALATNNGSLTLANGASFTTPDDFTNNGYVDLHSYLYSYNGTPSSLTVGGAFHNVDNAGNLTGSWYFGGGSVYYDGSAGVNGTQDITTIASGASLTLDGYNGSPGGFFGKTNPSYNHLALATNNGSFYLGDGVSFTTPGDFTNNGYVALNALYYYNGTPSSLTVGGAFHNVDNSGNLTGSWYLGGGSVYYDGSDGLNGSQDITTITSGASLTLDGSNGSVGGFFGKSGPSYNHLALTTNNGSLTLQNNASLATPAAFLNGVNANLSLHSGASMTTVGDLNNSGSLNISDNGTSLQVGGGLVNATNANVSVNNGATLTTAGDLSNNGTLNAWDSGTKVNVGGAFSNGSSANLNLFNGATLTTAGDFNNNGYTGVSGTGSSLSVGRTFESVDSAGNLTGNWDLNGGNIYYDGVGGVNNTQDIATIASGASLTLDGSNGSVGGFFGKSDPSYNHLALTTNNGRLTLQNNASLATPAAFLNGVNANLSLHNGATMTTAGDLDNNGQLGLWDNGTSLQVGGGLVNATNANVSVNNSATLTTVGDLSNNGTLNASDSGTKVNVGGAFANGSSANLNLFNGATLTTARDFNNNGNLYADGSSITVGAAVANAGSLELRNTTLTTAGDFSSNGWVGAYGSTLVVGGTFHGVDNSGDLTGNWDLSGSSFYYDGTGGVNNAQDITTISTGEDVSIGGTGGFFGKTDPSHNHLAPLAVNNGYFELDSAAFTTTGDFTNNGRVSVFNEGSGSPSLTVRGALHNVDNSGNLTGSWWLGGGNIYYDGTGGVNNAQDITTIASGAGLELYGPGGGFFGKTDPSHNHLAPLAINNGYLDLDDGASLTIAGGFTNNGSMQFYSYSGAPPNSFATTGDFTNNGSVNMSYGGGAPADSLTIGGTFHNVDNSGNLTGSWYLSSGNIYYDGTGGVNNMQDITAIAKGAEVDLGGTSGFYGKTDPSYNHLAPLAINNGNLDLENGASFTTAGSFTNNGSLNLSSYSGSSPSSFTTTGDFTNNGYVSLYGYGSNSAGSLTVGGTFHNVDNSGNLTGSWYLGAGGVYYDGSGGINGNQDITTIANGAWLALGASGGFFGRTDPSYNHLALATNNGSFELDYADFTTPGDFTNNGSIYLYGGNLTVGGTLHNVDTSGNLTGSWYLNGGNVSYDGTGGVNNTQDITTIASGASVVLDGSSGATSGFFGKTDPSQNHLAPLAVNNGTFALVNGATFNTGGDLTNNGSVEVLTNYANYQGTQVLTSSL